MSETLHTPLSSVEDDYRNSVEGNLHEFLDELCTVAIQSRNSVSSKWESYLKYVKGNQWPSNLPDYKSDFTLNLVEANIKRKAAYLTDTKPIIDIIPRDISLQPVAEILQLLVRGIWDERAVLAALTRCLYMAQIFGSGPMNLIWDEDLDFGNGEVNFISLDPRHFLMDPGIVTAEDLQQAEYIILEGVYPINLLKFLYPKEAPYIKADPKYSKYSTYASTAEESLLAPSGKSQRRPLKTGNVNLNDSSIPRAIVQEFWIKDRVLFKDLPEKTQKSINAQLESKGLLPKSPEDRVWPGGRHIIRAGGKILRDESNPYFDLQFPCELFSWGMAIEHPWGKSEVEEIMGINTVINKIGASMIENTLLMNNSVWIGDSNALLPEQWEKLTNKPGLTVKKRPGSQLERTPAPALPGSTFALQQWLTQQLQDISGMVDVLQGKAGNQTTGVAIEALQSQGQALLRLQARSMEVFLERLGQKLISRIIQFYSSEKIINILGPNPKLLSFEFHRDDILSKIKGIDPRTAFQDFVFKIEPLSSLTMSKMQKLISMSNLYSMGLVPGSEVLKAAQIQDPDHILEQARLEQAAKLQPQGSPIKSEPPNGPPEGKMPGPGGSNG